MSTSADQVARLLALIPYVQARPGVTLDETAAAFSISHKQLLADLWVAFMCGLPGGMPGDLFEVDMDAAEGIGVIRLTNAEILSKPLRLVPHEVATLRLALQAVRELAAPESYGAIDSASAKLLAMSWEEAPPAVVSNVTGDETIRQGLVDALNAGRRVRLTYDGARGDTTEPIVDPARIMVRGGFAYLEAWSVERGGWRSYRLDRIVSVHLTGERSESHGEPPKRGDWLSEAVTFEVTLRISPSAAWIVEYYPVARREGDQVTLRVSDPMWLRQLVLRLGAEAIVVDPVSAQDDAVRAARDALAAYAAWNRNTDPSV